MKITNRKAPFEFSLLDRVEAGISLSGAEVKSIKTGRANLSASFVRMTNGEAFLVNANLPGLAGSIPRNYDPSRSRKLLLHKNELLALETKAKQNKLTIVPISVYTKGRLIKIQIALGKPKRKFEKREIKRKKDIGREVARDLKN